MYSQTNTKKDNAHYQAVLRFNGRHGFIINVTPNTSGQDIYYVITSRYGLAPNAFYITNSLNHQRIICSHEYLPFKNILDSTHDQFLEIHMRLPGGSITRRIFKSIFRTLFAMFRPIIKPMRGIANAFLLLIKAIVYIVALFIWFFKLMVWFFVQFLPSLPLDIILLIKQLTTLTINTILQTISQLIGKVVNFFGRQTLYGMSAGWDNARDSTMSTGNDEDPKACKQHCYRAPDGSIPFGLVAVTVLCPPAGVFMEYGLYGWLKILVCLVLTLLAYFPGLIYALILLYC